MVINVLRTTLWACFLLLTAASAQSSASYGQSLDPDVLSKVKAATAFIEVQSVGTFAQGTGFFVDRDIVVTNAHVVGMTRLGARPPSSIEVVLNGGTFGKELVLTAELIAYDHVGDLAFLKVGADADTKLPTPLSLSQSGQLRETMPLFISGFPFGNSLSSRRNPSATVAPAAISNLSFDEWGSLDRIQINGNLSPGNSGGPIVDLQGRVVGISQATISATQIGFAIPAEHLKKCLAGRVIGASTTDIIYEDDQFNFTVVVTTCDPKRRIRKIDLLYWLGDRGVERPIDSTTKLPKHGAPGDTAVSRKNLTYDVASQTWKAQFQSLTLPVNREFWLQAMYVAEDGRQQLMSPFTHTETLARARVIRSIKAAREVRPPMISSQKPPQPPARAKSSALRTLVPAEIVEPVVPERVKALPTTTDKDDPRRTPVVTATAEELAFPGLLQMVASPGGDAVYMIFEGLSTVRMYDPTDLSLPPIEYDVPAGPVSLWCDSTRIVVACRTAKAVVILDRADGEVLRRVQLNTDENLVPVVVVGRAPDDSVMTLWAPEDDHSRHRTSHLYLVDQVGEPRYVTKSEMGWCTFCDYSTKLFAQAEFRGSPAGSPHLIDLNKQSRVTLFNKHILPDQVGFHRDFFHTFMTNDGLDMVWSYSSSSYRARTVLVTPGLERVEMEFDGATIAEVPSRNWLIAWRSYADPQAPISPQRPEIIYVNRATGEIVRKIRVTNLEPHPANYAIADPLPSCIFVPGHELFMHHDISHLSLRDAKHRPPNVFVVRCGPVEYDSGATLPGTSSDWEENNPPKAVSVGKPMVFLPFFTPPAGAQRVEFALKKGVKGMKLDPATGKLQFTPTGDYLGKYEVAIVAVVDGQVVPVISWTLEIEQ